MARDRHADQEYGRSIRKVLIGILVVLLLGIFLLWRIDNPRVEQMRSALIDTLVPRLDWALVPVAKLSRMVSDFQSYGNIYEQNQELRRELQRLKGWREAALQLEQQNAKLLDLNNVRISPKLSFITGIVLTDSGSPFRQSALINVGRRDGVLDGWATMDGFGLVGRISGVGEATSRVILLTDSHSRIPVIIQPSGQKAIMSGTNALYPVIEFLETPELVHPGDRVVSSGDGQVFPPGVLAGQIVLGRGGRYLVQLAADYQRLEFMRVLRSVPTEKIGVSDDLIRPPATLAPLLPPATTGASDG
ncbi:MAG: rod shape-determining protein MreC [Paracoccaceae bacterium]